MRLPLCLALRGVIERALERRQRRSIDLEPPRSSPLDQLLVTGDQVLDGRRCSVPGKTNVVVPLRSFKEKFGNLQAEQFTNKVLELALEFLHEHQPKLVKA